jgi:hypothetical protein
LRSVGVGLKAVEAAVEFEGLPGAPARFEQLGDGLGFDRTEFAAGHGFDEFVVGVEDVFGRVVIVGVRVGRGLGELSEVEAAIIGARDEAFEDELLGGGTALDCGVDCTAGDGRGGLFEERLSEERGLVERAFGAAVWIGFVTGQEPALTDRESAAGSGCGRLFPVVSGDLPVGSEPRDWGFSISSISFMG